MGTSHAMIDAVAVPPICDLEADEDPLGGGRDLFSDLDTFFRTAITEGHATAAEWKKSHHASVIDTKKYRGNVSKCLPTKGTFSYVHIDVNGEGGFAHIVEDEIKFGRNRALQALSEGPLGNTLTNLKIPLRSDQISKHVKEV
jgi:hypothetical protein